LLRENALPKHVRLEHTTKQQDVAAKPDEDPGTDATDIIGSGPTSVKSAREPL
jgi:hypothetical protein